MKETQRLLDQLARSYDGDAWHGPSLKASLEGVTAEIASTSPVPNGHTIWEIVLHICFWQNQARKYLETGLMSLPEKSDWPEVGEATEGNWQKTLQALDQSHQDFAATLASLGEEKLDEILGQERDKELGTGLSHYVTIHGVIQHNLYHAGQIVLLKKFN